MLKGLGLIISTSQHNAKPSTKDNIMEPNRNLDLLRIIQQQHQVRKLTKEISEKPENPYPKTIPVFKVLDLDRSEDYHEFCGESYEDWKNFKPNSWGY